jgi:hypothetical protein
MQSYSELFTKKKITPTKSELNHIQMENEIGDVDVCKATVNLHKEQSGFSLYRTINIGDKVKVTEIHNHHFKVYFNGNYDFVLKNKFTRERCDMGTPCSSTFALRSFSVGGLLFLWIFLFIKKIIPFRRASAEAVRNIKSKVYRCNCW